MTTYQVVSGIIRNEEDKILMLDHKKYGLWSIPVGKAEPGETLEEALKRELYEEINIVPVGSYIVNKFNMEFPQGITDTYVYEVTTYTGEIKNKEPEKQRT